MSINRTFVILLLIVFSILNSLLVYQVESHQKQLSQSKAQQEPKKESREEAKPGGAARPPKDSSPQAKQLPERPLELLIFINNVRSAPPEFAADLLIRIAESNKIDDSAWKRELLEEAFRLAPGAQQPVKRINAGVTLVDTRSGTLVYAFELNLDGLSLQCRAVKAMLAVDKAKARELFAEIIRPQLTPLTCGDALAYDVAAYYDTLKQVAETAFSPQAIKDNEPVRFIDSHLGQITSPAELAPALGLLATSKLSASQRESLVYTISKALASVSADDRSFTASLYFVDRGIKNLLIQCQQQGVPIEELLRSYRAYLVRHFSASRCTDNTNVLSGSTQAAILNDFNKELRPKSQKNIIEISADDVRAAKKEGAVKEDLYWQTPKSAALLAKIKALRFGAGQTSLSVAERETIDWEARLNDFLKDLGSWTKEDEKSAEDYFHQKCILLRGLIRLIPKKSLREEVIRSLVDFLNSFDLSRDSRIAWFWQVGFLFKDIYSPDRQDDSGPGYVISRSEMLPVLDTTKNPILYLYKETEKLFGK